MFNVFQETRNAAIPLELDDDTVSVQSQETDQKQEIPLLTLSKSSSEIQESTPQLIEKQKVKNVDELKNETSELEKKVKLNEISSIHIEPILFFKVTKREKGPAPLPPKIASTTQFQETMLLEKMPQTPSAILNVSNSLKIIEDEDEVKPVCDPSSENIPPPPPEFANQKCPEEISEIKVQFRSSGGSGQRVSVHQEVRRSYSVDSPATATLASGSKFNTSMITINDTSNSLATNSFNQVTVVTTHPPVIIDNSSEVVIVSNETNRSQHIHESSTDDDYQSFDSLESSPKNKSLKKLDESEVLIVNPFEIEKEPHNEEVKEGLDNLDTSHVSVVTVGEKQVKVKDSSRLLVDSNSDLSHTESSDGVEFTKSNGKVVYNSKRSSSSRENDVSIIVKSEIKERVSPDSSVDCSSSIGGDSPTRGHIENGLAKAVTSNNKLDRSDAESISTTASQDSDIESVQLRKKEPERIIMQPSSPKRPTRTKEEIQIANLKKKTRKRTRRFEIDGVQVTTTTSKVIYGDDENGRMYDDHIFRKQELRELKLLQKQEKKQFYDLQAKEQVAKEQQDKKFEQERLALERTYEADMDVLARQHKQQVEKYEQQQENELRNTSKKIRMEQERELKLVSKIFNILTRNSKVSSSQKFRDALKQELRLLKQEIDLLPKERRKDEFRKRKTSMEVEHEEREKQFLANLSEQHEIALRRISEIYREKMAATEKSYLQQRQTVRSALREQYIITCKIILIKGNAYKGGNDVGTGRKTYSRKAPAVKAPR